MKVALRLEELEPRYTPATIQVVPGPHALQSAIDAASAGDTLLIAHGTYREDIVITKPLTLIGQPDAAHQNPFIVGSGGANGKEIIVDVAPYVQNVSISHVAIGDSHGTNPIQVGLMLEQGAGFFSFSDSVIRKVRDATTSIPELAATVGLKASQGTHDITISHVALYNLDDPPGAVAHSYAYGIWLQGVNNVAIDHTYVKHVGDVGFFVSGGSEHVFMNYCAVEELLGANPVGFYVADSQDTLSGCKAYELAGNSIGLKLDGTANVALLYGAFDDNAYGVVVYGGSFTVDETDISGNRIQDILHL